LSGDAKTKDYSITKKLTRMNMLVSGAALLMACLSFVIYDLFTFREASLETCHSSPGCWFEQRERIGFSDPQLTEITLSL